MSDILVIDDDDQLRKSFHKLLTEEGYSCDKRNLRRRGAQKN